MVKEYVKIPVKIHAMQFKNNIECINALRQFAGNAIDIKFSDKETVINVTTHNGVVALYENDYLIKGVEGEFYPCKMDIFLKTYKNI